MENPKFLEFKQKCEHAKRVSPKGGAIVATLCKHIAGKWFCKFDTCPLVPVDQKPPKIFKPKPGA